ncbi:MAG TPA: sugar phosphate isomerase/epimerase family protein [Planctomycetota bacterium]|nr:sugar phosphate isomerase/epimerase family protein [Planctomycetota bacterium]
MKLAFSSNAFREFSLEDTIGILKGIGYQGLELMADRPHAWPEDMTPARIDSVRRALDTHKMQVSNVNAFMMCAYKDPKSGRSGTFHWPSWIDKDVDTREARIRHTIACVDVAAAVGAKTLSTEPGGPLEGRTREECYRLFSDGLKRAAERGREKGVLVCVEPEPTLLIEKGHEYEEFVGKYVDYPGVGLNFDMGHFYCVGEDPASLIRGVGRHAAHYHLEDIAADRVHFHLPPGEGAMDYKAIFDSLKAIKYQGWVTIELYPFQQNSPEVAKRAYAAIRPLLD